MDHLGIVQNMHPLCFDDIKAGLVSHQNTNICVWKQPHHIFPPKWLTFGDHLLCTGWFLQVFHRWTHLSWMTIIVGLIFQESQQRLTILHNQFKLTQRNWVPKTGALWPYLFDLSPYPWAPCFPCSVHIPYISLLIFPTLQLPAGLGPAHGCFSFCLLYKILYMLSALGFRHRTQLWRSWVGREVWEEVQKRETLFLLISLFCVHWWLKGRTPRCLALLTISDLIVGRKVRWVRVCMY